MAVGYRSQLLITNVVSRLPLGSRGSYYNYKMPFSNNHLETLKKKKGLLLTGLGNFTAHQGPHSKATDREGVHMGLGYCYY